jgi:hypothetical protein
VDSDSGPSWIGYYVWRVGVVAVLVVVLAIGALFELSGSSSSEGPLERRVETIQAE